LKNALNKSEEYESYYQMLGTSEDRLFSSMKDVFMTALIVGYLKDAQKPFKKSGGEPIKLHIFSQEDRNIMDIIALDKTRDLSMLLRENEEEKYKIIEEYANGGMEYLVEGFCKPVPSHDNLLKFVLSYKKDETTQKKDILDILNAVSSEI
jgi:dnd system-associated protein 4